MQDFVQEEQKHNTSCQIKTYCCSGRRRIRRLPLSAHTHTHLRPYCIIEGREKSTKVSCSCRFRSRMKKESPRKEADGTRSKRDPQKKVEFPWRHYNQHTRAHVFQARSMSVKWTKKDFFPSYGEHLPFFFSFQGFFGCMDFSVHMAGFLLLSGANAIRKRTTTNAVKNWQGWVIISAACKGGLRIFEKVERRRRRRWLFRMEFIFMTTRHTQSTCSNPLRRLQHIHTTLRHRNHAACGLAFGDKATRHLGHAVATRQGKNCNVYCFAFAPIYACLSTFFFLFFLLLSPSLFLYISGSQPFRRCYPNRPLPQTPLPPNAAPRPAEKANVHTIFKTF